MSKNAAQNDVAAIIRQVGVIYGKDEPMAASSGMWRIF
jgi:hypothetical protein